MNNNALCKGASALRVNMLGYYCILYIPSYILIANVQKNEEAFIVGCVRLVSSVKRADLFQGHKVNHMDVDLLGDGWRLERVLYVITLRPGPTVHIQIPEMMKMDNFIVS